MPSLFMFLGSFKGHCRQHAGDKDKNYSVWLSTQDGEESIDELNEEGQKNHVEQ